jgi:hypothetical protein
MRAIADTLHDHTAILHDHTTRLDRLEKLLDLEHRLERFEDETREKLRKIGEHLAIPELTI